MRAINAYTLFYLALIHVGALAAPLCFSWSGFGLFMAMYFLTALGITLGFHRGLTHYSFQTYAWFRWTLAFIGGLAGEGGVLQWVADHRAHHQFTDKPGDPHSPRDGFWWSHIMWTIPFYDEETKQAHFKRYCPDLLADPVIVFIDRTFLVWHFLVAGLFFYLGGWSWLLWGVFFRLAFVLHATWCVNSICHKWGYKNSPSSDDSTNCWWVALLTNGEGWHANHHAFPRAANHGWKWWEFDLTYQLINLLATLGLVWGVQTYSE